MSDLRPIGTEFKDSHFDFESTDGAVRVVTWRVVAYRLCDDYGVMRYLEEVDVVRVKNFTPKRITPNTYKLIARKQEAKKQRTRS